MLANTLFQPTSTAEARECIYNPCEPHGDNVTEWTFALRMRRVMLCNMLNTIRLRADNEIVLLIVCIYVASCASNLHTVLVIIRIYLDCSNGVYI